VAVDLPPQLEVAVRAAPVSAVVRPPGSKSLTNRALIVAALARGVSRIHDPLEADDTEAMRRGLRSLGVGIEDNDDPWLVLGTGGQLTVPALGIDAGEAGTVARFLTAVAALAPGPVTIDGRGRLRQRPMEELVVALERMGVKVMHRSSLLPITVEGHGLMGGRVEVDPSRSSQFVSALLLVAPMASRDVEVVMTSPPVSRPYLTSTVEVMTAFGARVEYGGDRFHVAATGYGSTQFEVEADASAAAYPLVAGAITGGIVSIDGIPAGSTQPDLALLPVLEAQGCIVRREPHRIVLKGPGEVLKAIDIDMNDAPDAAVAAAVACLFADGESRVRNIGNLRLKESDRLAALETELTRVGGKARIVGNDLVIKPGPLVPTVVNTYNDHRIAMAFALVGLRQPGIVIDGPSCVTKTWPGYFDMLAHL